MDEKFIHEMSQVSNDVSVNNVIVGLNDECFGLRLFDDPEKVFYQLFYINGTKGLSGLLLDMTLYNPNRDDIVFLFSNHLTQEFQHLDAIDVFNTFQQYTRSMLEKEGHFTISSLEMEKFKGKDSTIIAKGVKGISIIPLIEKVEFLRQYFGQRHTIEIKEDQNYIYLMLNKRNGLVKIGTSIRPKFREKTLQGEEPEIYLISIWQAPREIEKELHKRFSDKKKRGEWFKLKSRDLKDIKDRMIEFG